MTRHEIRLDADSTRGFSTVLIGGEYATYSVHIGRTHNDSRIVRIQFAGTVELTINVGDLADDVATAIRALQVHDLRSYTEKIAALERVKALAVDGKDRSDAARAAFQAGDFKLALELDASVVVDFIVGECLVFYARTVQPEDALKLVKVCLEAAGRAREDGRYEGVREAQKAMRTMLGL